MSRMTKAERDRRKLNSISSDIARSEERMVRALKEIYPKDSIVEFRKMYGQINPSVGTVIGHNGGQWGYVVIRYSTGNSARIPYKQISRCDRIVRETA